MTQDELKKAVAAAALEHIKAKIDDDTVLGIGTGSTANCFIDALAAMMIAQPWMLAVKDAMNASPQLRELRNSSQQAMIDAVISQIPPDMGGPKVSGKQQQAVLRLLLEMFGNGVQLAVNTPKKERPAIVKEVKRMINSYLDNYR